MKAKSLFTIIIPFVILSLAAVVGIVLAEPKEEKVEIHTIQGQGEPITEANMIKQVDTANAADNPTVKYVITSKHVHPGGYDPNKNDPCKINVWGLPKNPWAIDFPADVCDDISAQWGNVVILVPGDGNAPCPNDPNGSGIYLKPSTGAHELNHIKLGSAHSADPNNKMYPDNDDHGDGNGTHSCHRKGMNLTEAQRALLSINSLAFAQDVMANGRGGEKYDALFDAAPKWIDLTSTEFWMEWTGGQYKLHFSINTDDVVSFFDVYEIGVYVETDNDIATGEPPEGLDYYLAYIPQFDEIIFQRYEGFWVSLPPPEGLTHEFLHLSPDLNHPGLATGIKIDLPLMSFIPLSGSFAFKATATNYAMSDFVPDSGLLRYNYMPVPIPGDIDLNNKVDFEDLNWFCYDWLRAGPSRADIYPPMGDGIVNFMDYVVLANNWKAAMP